MIRAFVLGGDFHSRTAFGMYDYIQESVKKGGCCVHLGGRSLILCPVLFFIKFMCPSSGECILEWEGVGEPDKPVLKDKFAAERRKVL